MLNMISRQTGIDMSRICGWLPVVAAIIVMAIPSVKGQCGGGGCSQDKVSVEESVLHLAHNYGSSFPDVQVALEHNGGTKSFAEDHQETPGEHQKDIFYKDFKFGLKPPGKNAQKTDPIQLKITTSGGGPEAYESFYTELKFPCYRKFEIEAVGEKKQVGLGEGDEGSIEIEDPSYPYNRGVWAGVWESEDSQGNKFTYLGIVSWAGNACFDSAPFAAADVTVYGIVESEPGDPGDGGP